jgi:transcriptional regulator with XRE-family HTH domain
MGTRAVVRSGPQASEGCRALSSVLREKGWSQGKLARLLSELGVRTVTSGTVNRWLHGERSMPLEWALHLQELTGIDPVLWTRAPRKPSGKAA